MYRILVVEDDLSIAHVLQDGLVFEGFAVECVNDGRDVLRTRSASCPTWSCST
jgi:DNA-binding response OmpR family regulator